MQHILGLQIINQYISSAEERLLMTVIDTGVWMTDMKRRVQHYGYRYDYKKRTIDAGMHLGSLPQWGQILGERLHRDGFIPDVPDQIIVNEYFPGQGIAPHVDCEPCFGDTILSLSLGSSCVMEFTHLETGHKIPMLLEPCSLAVMTGEARYEWQHGIPQRKSDFFNGQVYLRQRRISLTFRKVILEAIPA